MNEAQKRADLNYKKKTMKQFNFMLHKVNEADIIEYLATIKNKREYFRNLIRKDMKLVNLGDDLECDCNSDKLKKLKELAKTNGNSEVKVKQVAKFIYNRKDMKDQ